MQNKQQNSTSIQNKNSQKTRNIRKPQFKGSSKKIYSSNFMVKHCSPLSTENKTKIIAPQFSSVAQSVWLCDPMDCSTPGFLVHHQLPGACSDSCPSSQWCHPAISSFVSPFFSHLQSFPASGSFPMSQLFTWGGESTGVSASVLPMNTQDWSPLEWTGWISLQAKGLSRAFSNTTVQKHQFFSAQLS